MTDTRIEREIREHQERMAPAVSMHHPLCDCYSDHDPLPACTRACPQCKCSLIERTGRP